MKALALRRVSSTFASACQALGRGRWLAFNSGNEPGYLTVGPLLPSGSYPDDPRLNLASKHGPLQLSNADALLSLLGETPVIAAGDLQPWYWQLINQQFSDAIYDLLSPLEPLPEVDSPRPDCLECRISAERGSERVHGVLKCCADTLLRLFDGADWQPIEQPWPGDWPLHYPLELGHLQLTVNELRSLRPGDVLLPANPRFTPQGQGNVQLGERLWRVHSETLNDHLQLRLIHEEDLHHE
ncbi:MAG: type III secretion system protein [Pseudomonas sp.]|uniref:type III secretion system protein n=1 Tax=Pseudomonas sp. TaxID=306 RepID=UPI003C76B499